MFTIRDENCSFPKLKPLCDDPLTAAIVASGAPSPLKERFLGWSRASPGIWGDGFPGEVNPLTNKFEDNPNYTWKSFNLNQQGHYTIKAVDYTKENAYSFDNSAIK